jgi:ABC-type glycerol-3-phosphate transport system permease component
MLREATSPQLADRLMGNPDAVITAMRNQVANATLFALAVVGLPALATSLYRAKDVGWNTVMFGVFEIQTALRLHNTLIGLILPYVTLNLAVSMLIMRGVFEQISPEIVDAARIDGASSWRILWDVMLPLVVNGIVVLIIVNFVTAWGEYLLAITLTNDQSVRTLPVVLAGTFAGLGEWAWPRIAAVYIMAIVPGLASFAIAQRWYTKGLVEGALKV